MSNRTVTKCVLVMLGCAFACVAPDPELPELEVTEEPEQEPALGEAEAEAEADHFRASYECAGGEEIYEFTSELVEPQGFEDEEPFYCLARCENHDQMSRANNTKVKNPSNRTDSWCLAYAAYYCSKLKRELESWCWGMEEEQGGGHHDDEDE